MNEPTTAAGREYARTHHDQMHGEDCDGYPADAAWVIQPIRAIEREAVDAWLASPQAADELARALAENTHHYEWRQEHEDLGEVEGFRLSRRQEAEAILAALRDQRGAS